MNTYWQDAKMNDLLGETPIEVKRDEYDDNESVYFKMESGREFMLVHRQSCCESVHIESIDADTNLLLDFPIVTAYESYQSMDESNHADRFYESGTWSFYHIGNRLNTLVIRFVGFSNGYYSETAQLMELK